jgi:isopenicillin N synthase-like dioxygenase
VRVDQQVIRSARKSRSAEESPNLPAEFASQKISAHSAKQRRADEQRLRSGNSVLRLIHYPDTGVAQIPGAVRAAQHEDINLLTVLPASTRPGLELLTRDGRWMAVETPPDVMICDTGDMMALLTNGRLPATTHRVVNPEQSDGGRLSMPFVLHPRPDAVLRPFGSDAPGVTAGAFLHERLVAIGVA